MASLPLDVGVSVHALQASDGAATNGFLFQRGRADVAVCIMHPREFLASHYAIPHLVDAGFAAFTQTPRAVGNDLRLEHEIALLDVAAGMQFLRAAGFRRIVLLGNSGGGSLYAFYNQQSLLAPDNRLATTPGGRKTGMRHADMPVADAVVLLSPHPGQGILLMNAIDPSVVDEDDAFAVDRSLDPFDTANGYGEPPGGASYAPAFVTRYRAAQRARIARIDERARTLIDERRAAQRTGDRRAGAHQQVFSVWRTDADLRNWDLSLDPSDREYGSLWGRDPFKSNWGSVGFARLCTPESWLSTWSGLTSHAALAKTAPAIEQPALMVQYSGDAALFPSDADMIFGAIGSTAKQRAKVPGNHHGLHSPRGQPEGRVQAMQLICDWISETLA